MVREDENVSHSVSVVIPARDEGRTVGPIVAAITALDDVAEVIVVDDGSTDETATLAAAAGAHVIPATDGPGKGAAMWTGVAGADGDIVVFCDADLVDFDPSLVTALASALADGDGTTAMVRADYERAGEGGRVTELAARPILDLLHPSLAHIAQPLGGEYAAWRQVLEQVPFVKGYGIEMGLLLHIAKRFGADAIGQVRLGERRHRNRPLAELNPQAREVLAVALRHAGVGGISVEELPPLCVRRPERRSA
jgi:glucosyl-3-phosphoglycerate synthase